jgi:uncharacterized protein (TIGR02001 family)
MKKLFVASAVVTAVAAPTAALAQAPAPAATPEHTLTGNVALVSDYRFRGLSQTFGEGFKFGPAIQGGFDYAHSSGFYAGNWNSSVSSATFPNGAGIEMDFYGGFKHSFGDFGLDVGAIYYYYPEAKYPAGGGNFEKAENFELYIGGSWKWFSAKYYYSVTDYFGLTEGVLQNFVGCNTVSAPGCSPLPLSGNTKGTQYFTASFNYEVAPKLTLAASLGYTWVSHYSQLDYLDYKVGVTYDLNGWLLGAALVGTDADEAYWYAVNGTGKVREVGEPTIVLSVGKTF